MKLGERLKVLRDREDMTQKELAKKVQLSKANICKYEKNSVEPNIETIVKVCEIFNVTSDYLLGITDNTVPDEKPTDEKKLTSKEATILNKYNLLNNLGQEKAEGYIDDLLINEKYTSTESKITKLKAPETVELDTAAFRGGSTKRVISRENDYKASDILNDEE